MHVRGRNACLRLPTRTHRCLNLCSQPVMSSSIASPAVCVETTGALPPRDLVLMALDVLREKCTKVATAFESALASDGRGVMGPAEVARATIAAMRTEPDDLSAR